MKAEERKERPVFTGVLKYFPKAIMEIARVSLQGNKQNKFLKLIVVIKNGYLDLPLLIMVLILLLHLNLLVLFI